MKTHLRRLLAPGGQLWLARHLAMQWAQPFLDRAHADKRPQSLRQLAWAALLVGMALGAFAMGAHAVANAPARLGAALASQLALIGAFSLGAILLPLWRKAQPLRDDPAFAAQALARDLRSQSLRAQKTKPARRL